MFLQNHIICNRKLIFAIICTYIVPQMIFFIYLIKISEIMTLTSTYFYLLLLITTKY